MRELSGWPALLRSAPEVFGRGGPFPLRAYSELMPPPYVGLKPYHPDRLLSSLGPPDCFAVTEYEEIQELRPGLEAVATHLLSELHKLALGTSRQFSRTLLEGNAAWPPELAAAFRAQPERPLTLIASLALSKTQDDKGRVPWTLFGSSHHGPARALWQSLPTENALLQWLAWLRGKSLNSLGQARAEGVRILPRGSDPDFPKWNDESIPRFAGPLLMKDQDNAAEVRAVVTFRPFARLPEGLRRAFLEGKVQLFPSPPSLMFFEHVRYRRLAGSMAWAMNMPLLHLFPRCEHRYQLRIPQSGWLDEHAVGSGEGGGGHRMVRGIQRRHRWDRRKRHQEADDEFLDRVTVALFSTEPEHLGLYGKPMARNAQIWNESYEPILDGPLADRRAILNAEAEVRAGGRFGYRFLYPPMRAGAHSMFWHRPVVARWRPGNAAVEICPLPLGGYVGAEREGSTDLELRPYLLDREAYREGAGLAVGAPDRAKSSDNIRKLLEWRELLDAPLAPSFAKQLTRLPPAVPLEQWMQGLPSPNLTRALESTLGPVPELPTGMTYESTARRDFEERLWNQIAELSTGAFPQTDNADAVTVNVGRTGGPRAQAAGIVVQAKRDLEALGDHLHRLHRQTIARHQMTGRALVADHRFRWETDFDFPWSEGWSNNQRAGESERNIVVMIPGRDRTQAVVMADHYDTAYMEDCYDPKRGGDHLRAAARGADDNHSATSVLLLAADVLLPLSRSGMLARDVWLVHLTGEEFPSDCLGARALAQACVERSLQLTAPDHSKVDVSGTQVVGAFVLDMVAHNNSRARDIFQIAPGEGQPSARLALVAHRANERWNALAHERNRQPDRRGLGRARRVENPGQMPPPFEHLCLAGQVRPEWDPKSALYNTDGQIFSDLGIPVVLLMENYDLNREGYHDTQDTMKNIDLDYASALGAIAIETVTQVAMAES